MVPLFFSDGADLIREIQSGFEVGKFEFPLDVVIINDVPIHDLRGKRVDLIGGKRRHSPSTWNTRFFGKSCHVILLKKS